MKFRATNTTDILDKPDGAKIDDLFINEEVDATGKTSGAFMEVDLGDHGPARWVREDDLAPVDPAARQAVNVPFFVQECINDERIINDLAATGPWFVSADFLITRAIIETNITNAGAKNAGSDAVGPLQVSSAEWKDFLDHAGDVAKSYGPNGFDHWLKQIMGAAYRMHTDAKAISGVKLQKGVGSEKDPFLPSLLDVFHAYLTNSPAAAVAILDAQNTEADKSRKISDVLLGPLKQEQIDALFVARGQFMGTSAAPNTVSQFAAATGSALDDALKKALDLIQQDAPEELPQLAQVETPWFDVALEAEKENIDEHNPAQKDIILDYFKATDLPRPNQILAWCGAFAAHCMQASGNPAVAAAIPKGAAAAASWKGFGDALSVQSESVPVGAVVVLSPSEGTGTTGHVGFFSQFLEGRSKVELLGGNQGGKVQKSRFLASRIAAIRWIGLVPSTSAQEPGGEGAPSATPISQQAIDLIVNAEVSSEQAYNRLYHKPTWPGGASGVTIGIGYDVGYTTPQKLMADWKGQIPDAMITQLQNACDVKGTPARPLARQLADAGVDVPFDKAMAVFLKRDVPRWVGIVERALPNTNALSKDSLGALVSLAYNRGASFSRAGDRYVEMNNIRTCMASPAKFIEIPDQFRSMKRLWPDMKGLRDRRDAEANLFAEGLTGA